MTTAILCRHIAAAVSDASPSTVEIEDIVRSAEGFARDHLAPLNLKGDRIGSRLENGRVVTPHGHKAAWRAYCDAGWPLLDADPRYGGLGPPTGLASAVQEIFDQACPAFDMMSVPMARLDHRRRLDCGNACGRWGRRPCGAPSARGGRGNDRQHAAPPALA